MSFQLPDLPALHAAPFNAVIDVRSPAEYAEDHIPGAINLPVLSNEERARVGTIYVRQSRFEARRIGAALVARNAAAHLEGHLADKARDYRPLVYCWRGGQRSNAFATILQQVGWRAETLDGGYKSYRRAVSNAVAGAPFPCPIILIDGNTGTAKTEVLQRLANLGVQTIDLEHLANHRGSLFGAQASPQPSQKAFESAIAHITCRLNPCRAVLIEAESSKIGQRVIPPALWAAMKQARRISLQASLSDRAAFLVRAYSDIWTDAGRLAAIIGHLAPYHPRATINAWLDLARQGAFETLAAGLMAEHYDPRYAKQRALHIPGAEICLHLPDLDAASLDARAAQILSAARALIPAV